MQIKKHAYDAGSGYGEGEYGTTEVSLDAENMLQNVYLDLLGSLKKKLRSPSNEERGVLHKSLSSFILELSNLYKNTDEAEGKKEVGEVLKAYQKVLRDKFGGKMADVNLQELQQAQNPQQDEGGDGGGGLPGMASRDTIIVTAQDIQVIKVDKELADDLLNHYAEKACQAFPSKDYVYDLDAGGDFAYINIREDHDQDPIVIVRVNRFLHVDSVMPAGDLNAVAPFHTVYFYQNYWKPIVDSIGHFFLDDFDTVILSAQNELPDTPSRNQKVGLCGWDVETSDYNTIDISFDGDKDKTWYFDASSDTVKKAKSENEVIKKYAEQEYINAVVRCIDKSLPSLYGRMGRVVEILPRDEMSVMFFTPQREEKVTKEKEETHEDNLVVRLVGDQIEVLNDAEISASF